jgi:hypothetical protein
MDGVQLILSRRAGMVLRIGSTSAVIDTVVIASDRASGMTGTTVNLTMQPGRLAVASHRGREAAMGPGGGCWVRTNVG